MKKPKLVIFDMDGLMLDTESLVITGMKAASRDLHITIPNELLKSVIGLNSGLRKTKMREALGQSFDYDMAESLCLKSIDEIFEKQGVPLKPGLLRLLDKLEQLEIRKAVATSTMYNRAIYKLTKANIAHRFEAIIGGDMVANSKPAPDIFLKAAGALNIPPADCIILEDSNPGAEGACRAGMRVIVVPDLVPPSDATRKQAFAICESLYDVCKILQGLV